MKRLLDAYAKYSSWANERLANVLVNTDSSVLNAEVLEMPTILQMVKSMNETDILWYERLRKHSIREIDFDNTELDKFEILKRWTSFSRIFSEFVISTDESYPARIINYRTVIGTSFSQTAATILLHCHNESSFQRGQLIAACRQLNIDHLPSIDFLTYCRAVNI